MMLAETILKPRTSPYGEDTPGEIIRSTRFRLVIRPDKQCWELQAWPGGPSTSLWRHMAYSRSRKALAALWHGLHGNCARHCWPELAHLPAKFGGGV